MVEKTLVLLAVAIGAYLFGNINTALLITKAMGQDIRTIDSGNPGAMNMVRNFGKKLGALTLVLDAVKGVIPCVLGWLFVDGIGFGDNYLDGIVMRTDGRIGMHVAAISVVVGHVYPVFLKFKGGKGIASSIGACFVAQPIVALIATVVGLSFIFIVHMGSVGSFIVIGFPLGIEGYTVTQSITSGGLSTDAVVGAVLIFVLFALTVWAHRKNIVRLFRGNEAKTVVFKKKSVLPSVVTPLPQAAECASAQNADAQIGGDNP